MVSDILLVDFDMLMNYDYAILQTNRIINNKPGLQLSDNTYSLLQSRERRNVLSIDYPDENDEQLNERSSYILDNFSNIVCNNIICNPNIFNVVNTCNKNKMVDVTICCKTEFEQQIIKELFGYKHIFDGDVKVGQFDTFMVHTTNRITNPEYFKRYIGKCVYLAMTRYNLDLVGNNLALPENLINLTLDKVNLRLIGLFNNIKEE